MNKLIKFLKRENIFALKNILKNDKKKNIKKNIKKNDINLIESNLRYKLNNDSNYDNSIYEFESMNKQLPDVKK